jgi:DNA segregation ATPase FtsK/SpoIIIE, S-DNA-T family
MPKPSSRKKKSVSSASTGRKNSRRLSYDEDLEDSDEGFNFSSGMRSETRSSIVAIVCILLAVLVTIAAFGSAGVVGKFLYADVLKPFVGYGVVLVPILLVTYAIMLFRPVRFAFSWLEGIGGGLLFLGTLGILQTVSPVIRGGGWLGAQIGTGSQVLFGGAGSVLVLVGVIIASILVLFNEELRVPALIRRLIERARTPHELSDSSYDEAEWMTDPSNSSGQVIDEEEIEEEVVEEEDEPEEIEAPKKSNQKLIVEDLPAQAGEEEFIAPISKKRHTSGAYVPPPVSLLSTGSGKRSAGDIKAQLNLIKRTLQNFGIPVEMDEVSVGPTVTRFAMKPAEGIKLSRIVALKQDLALALAAHPLRIEAPIPGKSLVGIEIPNKSKEMVGLGSLVGEAEFQNNPKPLMVAMGRNVTGKSSYADIGKMPHLLIAGTTGSGKSVTAHNLILSLIYRNGPDDVRLILVDPKRVELTLYGGLPHLLTPVIKEPKKAILALRWAAKEMERRYDLLESHGCRDMTSYRIKRAVSAKATEEMENLPFIVILIDELADIMQAFPRELESAIVRLAQMSRATGIHLILSTQRPSVNVITGLIKANVPSRLALQVASQIDSRTILDSPGAESLLGAGDMLFQGADMNKPERLQCSNVTEEEVKRVVSFIKENNEPMMEEVMMMADSLSETSFTSGDGVTDDDSGDELMGEATRIVTETGKASTSFLQRKLKIGYSRAARLIDLLEERGVVGPADGAKPREVFGAAARPSDDDTEDVGYL